MSGLPTMANSMSEVMSSPYSSPPKSRGSRIRVPVAVAPAAVFGVNVNPCSVPAEVQHRADRPAATATSWSTLPVRANVESTDPETVVPHSFVLGSPWSLLGVILALLTRQDTSSSEPVAPMVSTPGPSLTFPVALGMDGLHSWGGEGGGVDDGARHLETGQGRGGAGEHGDPHAAAVGAPVDVGDGAALGVEVVEHLVGAGLPYLGDDQQERESQGLLPAQLARTGLDAVHADHDARRGVGVWVEGGLDAGRAEAGGQVLDDSGEPHQPTPGSCQ